MVPIGCGLEWVDFSVLSCKPEKSYSVCHKKDPSMHNLTFYSYPPSILIVMKCARRDTKPGCYS